MSQVVDSLDAARDAAARQAWRASYDAYSAVDRSTLTPEDLESFADAAWWTGKLDDAIKHRERAYAGYSSAGDKPSAARLALTLSWDHEGRAAYAVSQGWFATAQRLLEGLPESVEHGRVILTEALGAMMAEGDLPKATELFERASEVGGRIGDRDLQMLALAGKARALIMGGEVEQGLALHDEASAAAVCGELKPFATGMVYCLTISSCQDVGDFRRAAEWTEAANRWCDQADVSGFPGTCRLHRAEIMRLRGDWPAAEQQAVAACEELRDFDRHITAGGYYEVGEIRRRRGDFAGAEEAYRTANEWGRNPQPGLGLLRLAEGKVDSALAGIANALGEVEAPLLRLRGLPALVEVAIAAGDLRKARDEWQRVGAPYEAAQARMLLGTAIRRSGDEHGATVELEGALAAFERLGAKLENPKAAIDAAIGIQRALGDEIVAPDVRIGAHTGEAFRTGADASDYGGQGVHVAARIGAAAGGGEIVVSRETLDGIATGFRLSEPRAETLKGFAQPVEVVSVDWR